MTFRILARPRLIGLVVAMLCLLGVASYLTMARQEDPSFPYRAGLITVAYPGAMAESVERLVLEPLSDELSQVEEIDYFTATVRTGVALVSINLADAIYDTDSAWDRVRQAMERARLEFPDGVQQMALDDRLIDIPAVVLAVRGSDSLVHLSRQAEQLKRALADVPGCPGLISTARRTSRSPLPCAIRKCSGWGSLTVISLNCWRGAIRSFQVVSWCLPASAWVCCRTVNSPVSPR